MRVVELLGYFKRVLIVAVGMVILAPLARYLLTPSVYYVKESGAVRVYARALDGPALLQCPRFRLQSTGVTLVDHYASRKMVVKGQFEYVLYRGLRSVGPATIELPGGPDAPSAVVRLESTDHPFVPNAFIHLGSSVVSIAPEVSGAALAVEAKWHGSVEAPNPPLESVLCGGKPVPRRLTGLGVF